MKTYRIVRHYKNFRKQIVATGLTLKDVQKHCDSTEASSKTCTNAESLTRTQKRGPWFDGYYAD